MLFTVNPLTGREEELLIEAVFGLGEPLVAGRVAADRYVIAAGDGRLLRQELAVKRSRLVPVLPGEAGGPDGAGAGEAEGRSRTRKVSPRRSATPR